MLDCGSMTKNYHGEILYPVLTQTRPSGGLVWESYRYRLNSLCYNELHGTELVLKPPVAEPLPNHFLGLPKSV